MIPKILLGTLRGESLPITGSTKPKPVPYLVERMHHYGIKNKDSKKWFNLYFLCALNLLTVAWI